jgi:hypothetical protein
VLAYAALHTKPKTESADHGKPVPTEATALAAAPVVAPPVMPVVPVEPAPVVQNDPQDANHHDHHVHVTPFGNGGVTHGNVLKLKMDGVIEKINGAAEPTGFSVSLPGRRALEPAGPLASRDNRIASIKVSNEGTGSELDIAFKDGVPSYVVRAKGDVLEIVLASPGKLDGAEPDKVATKKKTAHKKPVTP